MEFFLPGYAQEGFDEPKFFVSTFADHQCDVAVVDCFFGPKIVYTLLFISKPDSF